MKMKNIKAIQLITENCEEYIIPINKLESLEFTSVDTKVKYDLNSRKLPKGSNCFGEFKLVIKDEHKKCKTTEPDIHGDYVDITTRTDYTSIKFDDNKGNSLKFYLTWYGLDMYENEGSIWRKLNSNNIELSINEDNYIKFCKSSSKFNKLKIRISQLKDYDFYDGSTYFVTCSHNFHNFDTSHFDKILI